MVDFSQSTTNYNIIYATTMENGDGKNVDGNRLIRIVDTGAARVLAVYSLPFPPGAMVRCPDGRVVVADAFGSRLAVLTIGDVPRTRTWTVDGVNLSGLAVSGDGKEVLIVHMAQTDTVPITAANIDRGAVLSSALSAVRIADFAGEPEPDEHLPMRTLALDGPVHGAADPSALAVSADGTTVLISLAGAHQVLKSDRRFGAVDENSKGLLPLGHNQRLEVVWQRLPEGRMAHAERVENMPLDIRGKRFARNAFDDISGKCEAVIGVGFDIALGKETQGQVFYEPAAKRLRLGIS